MIARLPRIRLASLAPFTIVVAVYVFYLRTFAEPHFYFDADVYWSLGGSFGSGGHFSLLNFDAASRGYALPLYNRLLSSIAAFLGIGNVSVVQITGALEAALLGTVLIPRIVRTLCPAAVVTPLRILAFNAVVFLFWRDYFGYPLSDFPAATLAIVALYAVTRRSLAAYAFAGLVLGVVWNVRQSYIATLLVVLVIILAREGIRRAPVRTSGAVGLVLAGVFVASLPQVLINHHHGYGWSPTVADAKMIALGNLYAGLINQRYETSNDPDYPLGSVRYLDPSTQAIIEEEHLDEVGLTSYRQYAEIVARHPTDMLAAYTRRVFNGLDVRFATPYIRDLDATSEWFSLVNYSLLFIAGARLLVPAFRRKLGKVSWPEVVAMASAVVLAIPLGSETRYYIPVQLIVYSLVFFAPGTRRAWAELGHSGRLTLALSYPAFLLLCIALSTSTIALMQFASGTAPAP